MAVYTWIEHTFVFTELPFKPFNIDIHSNGKLIIMPIHQYWLVHFELKWKQTNDDNHSIVWIPSALVVLMLNLAAFVILFMFEYASLGQSLEMWALESHRLRFQFLLFLTCYMTIVNYSLTNSKEKWLIISVL